MASKFQFDSPTAALHSLAERLEPTEVERGLDNPTGRVLASPVIADRDSPAADVSAMDGYAIRMSDLGQSDPVSVSGESVPGSPPPAMQADSVVRIFTGAIVPEGCEAVVKREDTEESASTVRFLESAKSINKGEHIRRAGENASAGSEILLPGTRITPAHRATMANFGCTKIDVHAPVRVSIITTVTRLAYSQMTRLNLGSSAIATAHR